ncbi:MAG: MerR family transcriptional regulator [Eggerthellaceae bacterium]|jgi:DNA-binding transcriptional MerR regulator
MHTMLEVCELTGLSYQTLKYYCNEGLVPRVKRDGRNRRVFDDHDVAWIKDLSCLKKCGFSIKDMKRYLELCLQGKATIPERQAMLDVQRAELERRLNEIQTSLDYIDWKQAFYDDVQAGRRPYESNLIGVDEPAR